MKQFSRDSKMFTMGGVFYPKGYVFVMYPEPQDADKAVSALLDEGFQEDEVISLSPEMVLHEISAGVDRVETGMPSVGTEESTVRRYAELARKGHYSLLIHAPSDDDTERVLNVIRSTPFSVAEKYHLLAIELLH